MFASRLFQLLILAVAIVCVAQAAWPENPRLAMRGLVQRQNDNDADGTDGGSAPVTNTGAASEPTTAPAGDDGDEQTSAAGEETTTSSVEETSSSSSQAEPTQGQNESSPANNEATSTGPSSSSTAAPPVSTTGGANNAPPSTTGGSSPEQTSSSTNNNNNNNNNNGEDEDTRTTATTTSHSRVVSTSIQVIVMTNSDGSESTSTSTSLVTSTSDPELSDDNSGNDEGMSTQTRNTIIGVVVGVGGAVILGALAIVGWRLRSRKKQAEENDGLMAYDNNAMAGSVAEKSDTLPSSPGGTMTSSSARNPFQSTLENYHQPAPVNPSSNF